MRRTIISIFTLIATISSMNAQLTAADAFASAPLPTFPLVDKTTRLDMIDYFNSGSSTASNNTLRGSSRITAISPMKVCVEMSASSTYQIAILPTKGDSVIAVVETLRLPAADSRITLYDRHWTPLDAKKQFTPPSLSDWLTDEGRRNRGEVESIVPFLIVDYDYDPTTATLTLTNSLSEFVAEADRDAISRYLHPTLAYKWDGKKFASKK